MIYVATEQHRANLSTAARLAYSEGRRAPNGKGIGGRPLRKDCCFPGCDLLPRHRQGFTGPFPRYCSDVHAHAHQRLKRLGFQSKSYDEILTDQGGGCAICGTTDPKAPGRSRADGISGSEGSFHVDHDHACCATGCAKCFRGLLCSSCNRGLGQFKDSPEFLRAAADYLEK